MCKMMISPGIFFIFLNILIFWVISGVKEHKMAQNDKTFCVALHISGTIHHMIVIYGTLV